MLVIRLKRLLAISCVAIFTVYSLLYILTSVGFFSPVIDQVYIDMGDFQPNRSYVFFDLGANNGDSLANFFQLNNTIPVKFHFNELVNKIKWKVVAFEANPIFDSQLLKLKTRLSTQHQVQLYSRTAAWIRNGVIDFYLDTVNEKKKFWGSSLKRTHPDVLQSGANKIQVPCVDVAELVRKFNPEDFVFMKIDIEGAEYDLLLHLFKSGVLNLIDYIAVEYHPDSIDVYSAADAFNYVIKTAGVKHIKWY
jgi:FkbM family methyltransferase